MPQVRLVSRMANLIGAVAEAITWNTFATGGRCPACKKVWEVTQCVVSAGGCEKWSPHLDWYEGLDDIVNALKEAIKESWKEVLV